MLPLPLTHSLKLGAFFKKAVGCFVIALATPTLPTPPPPPCSGVLIGNLCGLGTTFGAGTFSHSTWTGLKGVSTYSFPVLSVSGLGVVIVIDVWLLLLLLLLMVVDDGNVAETFVLLLLLWIMRGFRNGVSGAVKGAGARTIGARGRWARANDSVRPPWLAMGPG